jgi:hypothetical protein
MVERKIMVIEDISQAGPAGFINEVSRAKSVAGFFWWEVLGREEKVCQHTI